MKVAIITDTHFGARNDNSVFSTYFNKFYDEVFFPYIDEHEIKTVLHLGDLIDRRKYINFLTLHNSKKFIRNLHDRGITTHMILGNHDTYYKNTNDGNGVNEIFSDSTFDLFYIYQNDPVELELGSTKILMVPWITADNSIACTKAIADTSAQILMGHLEIQGFEMMKGQPCHEGFDKKLFKKFDSVYSGHFHHPSKYDNIEYLGAPYEMNWTDFEGKRGFHILDTETRELTFIPNPFRMFHKITYSDKDLTVEDIDNLDTSLLTSTYIKVIIKDKENPYIFDLFVDKLQSAGAADIKIVEDHMNMDDIDEDDLIDEAQDTHTILSQYIDGIETKLNKVKIKTAVHELYNEAINL